MLGRRVGDHQAPATVWRASGGTRVGGNLVGDGGNGCHPEMTVRRRRCRNPNAPPDHRQRPGTTDNNRDRPPPVGGSGPTTVTFPACKSARGRASSLAVPARGRAIGHSLRLRQIGQNSLYRRDPGPDLGLIGPGEARCLRQVSPPALCDDPVTVRDRE